MQSTFFDKTFRDEKGDFVIAQPPNIPISIWFLASASQLIFPTGDLQAGLNLIAVASLFIWSVLELLEGVNYFRKGLGAIGLFGLIMLIIQ
jgi:hypothetical protein